MAGSAIDVIHDRESVVAPIDRHIGYDFTGSIYIYCLGAIADTSETIGPIGSLTDSMGTAQAVPKKINHGFKSNLIDREKAHQGWKLKT